MSLLLPLRRGIADANRVGLTVRDPLLMAATEKFEYYVQKSLAKDWQNPTREDLVESVNALHKFTRQLVTEKGRIQQALLAAHEDLKSAKRKIMVLSLVVVADLNM